MVQKILSYPFIKILNTSGTLALTYFKLRTEGSLLGVLWYVLEPLLIFGIVFLVSRVVLIEHANYAAYLFLGLMMFNLFASATTQAASALLSNREYIKWLRVDFEIFPLAHVAQFCLAHGIELVMLASIFLFSGLSIVSLLLYPLVLVPFLLFIVGVSLILSVVSVYTNDIANAWRILIGRLLWLGTPIFYILTPGTLLWELNQFNPLFYFLSVARSVLIDNVLPEPGFIILMIAWSVGVLAVGVFVFVRTRSRIPEYL